MQLFQNWWDPAYVSWKPETGVKSCFSSQQHVSREEHRLQVSICCCAAPGNPAVHHTVTSAPWRGVKLAR